MTDSDLNFLIVVIGCMLAAFWVIGRIWLAIASHRLSSSLGPSAAVAVRPATVAAGRLRGLRVHRDELGAHLADNPQIPSASPPPRRPGGKRES